MYLVKSVIWLARSIPLLHYMMLNNLSNQTLMSAMRRQMDVIKSVSTPMDLTHVLVELATDLLLMGTLAVVC